MANRYWVGGNANWDGTAGTKWATTSGGAGGSAVPTNVDDVFLDNGAGTGNVTLASGYAAVCKSITCTGYVNTLASANATGSLTVAGAITFVAGMTLSITNTMSATVTATLTSGGKTFAGILILGGTGTQTHTLGDNWAVSGTLRFAGNSSEIVNGNTFNVSGSLQVNTNSGIPVTGTTTITMNGTGTWSHSASGWLFLNLTFNTAGTITVSGNVYIVNNTLTYTAGTMVWAGSTLNTSGGVSGNTTVLNLSGQTINNYVYNGSGVAIVTLSANLTVAGNYTIIGNGSQTMNGNTLYVGGNFAINQNTGILALGTTTYELNGTGTWSHLNANTLNNNVVINTAGTITISGNVYKAGASTSITYTAGTVTTTGSTLNINADITLNTNGMSWNNISPTGTRTLTLNSLLTVTGTWTCVATTTFAGSSGWTITNWTCVTAGVTVTFANGKTYTLSGGTMTNTGTAASKILFTSDHATIKAILTLTGVTQSNVYLSGTRMDSSLGATVWTVGGILTTTLNWNLLTAPATVASGFVN